MPILEDIPDIKTQPTGGILLEDIPDTDEDIAINKAAADEEIRNRANPALNWYYNPVKAGQRAGEVFDIATENNLPLPDVQKTVDDITKEISRYYAVDPSGAPIPLPPVSKASYLQPENIDMENLGRIGDAIAKQEKAHPAGQPQIAPNIPLEGFDGKVNLIKTALREMPASHYYALQAFTNIDPFAARQYLLRHIGKYITPDMPDFFPAFYEASRQVQGETGWNEIKKYTGIAENIAKVGVEFWGLGGVKAAMGLTTAAKFAVQNVLQAPTTQEESQSLLRTVQERILTSGKSALIGVAVAGAGKYIPSAYIRIPVVTGGFAGMGAIEAPRGEKLNSAIENAITILGFEAVGLAQKGLLQEAAKSAVKVNPDLSKIEPKELETLMRDFNKQLPDDIRIEPPLETPAQTPEITPTASLAAKSTVKPWERTPEEITADKLLTEKVMNGEEFTPEEKVIAETLKTKANALSSASPQQAATMNEADFNKWQSQRLIKDGIERDDELTDMAQLRIALRLRNAPADQIKMVDDAINNSEKQTNPDELRKRFPDASDAEIQKMAEDNADYNDLLEHAKGIIKRNDAKSTENAGVAPDIKPAETSGGQYLYHNTSQRNFEDIKKSGLTQPDEGGYPHGEKEISDNVPRIYLSENTKRALQFGGMVDSPTPELRSLLLRINKNAISGKLYNPKTLSGTGETWLFDKGVPPEYIEYYANGEWLPITGKLKQPPTPSASPAEPIVGGQKAAGTIEPVTLYHGTDKEFDVTKLEESMPSYEGGLGKGIYFGENKATAEFYGKNVYKVSVKISNPLIVDAAEGSNYRIAPEIEKHYNQTGGFDSILVGESIIPFDVKIGNKWHEIRNASDLEDIGSLAKDAGYDAVIARNLRQGSSVNEEVLVFDKNQIETPTPAAEATQAKPAEKDLAGQGKIKEGDTQTSIGAARDIKLDEALNRAIEKQGTAYTKQVKGKWTNSTEVPEYGDYYLTENGKAKFVEGKKLFTDESEAIKAGQYVADNTKKPQYVADTKEGFELTDTPPDIDHAEILPAGEGLTKDERALLSPQQIAEAEIAQQEGGKVGFKKGRSQALKEARQKLEAFKMVNALTDKLRIEASDMVYEFVPREKRGDFIKRILEAKTDAKVKSLTEDIEKYLSIAEKRLALSAIKKAVGRVKESNSIAVDYVEAINSLLGDIDLTKVSEATKDRVASAKEYIERQRAKGEDVSLPNKLLNSIERLNKKNIENITTEELKQLHEDIVRLEKIGRTKLKLTKERYERKKQEDLVRLKADSKPMTEKEMTKPEKIGEKLPIVERIKNTLRNVFNVAARKHLAITPMDVFFDRLDGTKNYKGANCEIFKKPLDKRFSKFLDTRNSVTLPIVELANKLGMKEGNFDRIGVHAVREQEGGEQKLLDTGYTKEQIDAVELSPQEMELYNAMRKSLDELRPFIEEVMRVTYNQPLGTVKNYFSFMTDFEAMSDYEMRDRFTDMNPDMRNNYRKNTEKGFTKERVGGKQKIKINAMEVFTKHVDNATYLVEMGSEIKRLGEIAASPQYREAVGDLGQEEVRGWIDLLARKGKQAGDRIGLLDTLRKHTGAAVLGFKLSSTLIQPTALLDGGAMIGHYAFEGAFDIATSRAWREFSLKNFPELRDRAGDDPAYLDFGGTGIVTKVERAGFWALQKLDGITASSVTAGAYKKYMVEHKLEIDFDKPNADAIDYAQLILRKTQSSSFFKDLPPAFTRGELTGNKSLDRLVLQFQSFMLTRWSLIEHDMLRAGIKGGNTGQMMNIFFFLSLATLAEIGIRRLSKETVATVTGSETKDWSETFTKEVIINALENVPFVSQAVNFANYGNVPVPTIGLMQNIGDRIVQLSRTKDPDKRQAKELEILILLFGTLSGTPGTLQVADIVKKLLAEPKQTNVKLHHRK